MTFILWLILAVLSWPLALLALIAYPIVWLLLLPFRVIGISVTGILDTLGAIVTLPGRLLGPTALTRQSSATPHLHADTRAC